MGAAKSLEEYLPGPVAQRSSVGYDLAMPIKSIGQLKAFYGNFSVLVRAYSYIRLLGKDGLRKVAEGAVLNANS